MQSPVKSRSRFQPLAAAVLFAVSFMVAFFALSTPHFNASDTTWIAFWNNRTHRITEIVSVYAALVAGGALIWLAAQIARHLARPVIYHASWASAVMLWVSAVLFSAAPAAMAISGSPPPSAEVDRVATDMGAAALTWFAIPVAAFLVIVTSLTALRTGAMPRWLCSLGLVIAVIVGVGGIAYFPLPLLAIWLLLAGASLSFPRVPHTKAIPATA
ncbi:MAG: hypothetical protein JO286_17510 [Solirubrobacterales bacterium]|nr:hypothetical protein [Solirubrobacterales bacterium]MBV9808986.1 hypothetical protein [Solirubrobacterales bacterium]